MLLGFCRLFISNVGLTILTCAFNFSILTLQNPFTQVLWCIYIACGICSYNICYATYIMYATKNQSTSRISIDMISAGFFRAQM